MPASSNEDSRPRPPRPLSQPSQLSSVSTGTNIDVAPSIPGSGPTPDMSDDESLDMSPQDRGSPADSVKSSAHGPGKSGSDAGEPGGSDAAGDTGSMPVQKRRRVTRACDECRRKKIKCDGKQPCTHCSVYSYECTYDKPSNRRRNPAPQYIEALETRLQRAEALLRKFVPDVDLTDPDLDPAVQQEFRNREQARARAMRIKSEEGTKEPEIPDAQIMSMIETIGQLDLNEGGEWDFHGISSGAVFLRRMKEHFKGILGNDYRIPFLPRPARPAGMFSLDSPRSNVSSPWDVSPLPNIYDLPPQEKVRTLCYYSLNCATCLLRIVHIPSFYEMLDRLYEKPQESWGNEEHKFLGLLYSVMALGCMYNVSEDNPSGPPISYKSALEEGTKYYASARLILQDVAECRDMVSLQGLLFMILFLQATSNISGCYAFLGIALRSSLRMGLHRHLSHAKITPIEDETRRRVFHVVRQMDTYVSAILGFPILLHDEDIDQPMPTEVDDEYITKDTILAPPPGTPSFFQGCNAHNNLMGILSKVIKYIYPLKGVEECVMNGERPNATYMISYSRIKEIERELHDWYEKLPIYWRPSHEGPMEVIRVRTLLRFGYAHVQMMLYRPFLHYVSPRLTAGKKIDDRYYNCAAAGISVSRNIIHIGIEIQKQAVLIGPYWFILYTQFFAILSLIFYVLENPDKPGSAEILADAKAGREVISNLAQRSLSADRITSALNAVFEQLPESLKNASTRPTTTKKRSAPAPGSKAGSVPLQAHPGVRENTLPQRRSEELVRPQPGPGRREVRRPQRTTSFDTVGLQQNGGLAGQNFATNLQELLPLDITMRGTSSDSSSTAGGAPGQRSAFPQTGGSSASSIYKLDAMMFPSADPFAYPNQPLLDPVTGTATGGQQQRQASHPSGTNSQAQDAMQFYMTNIYDDIEGQLLGPIPPYLVQPAHAGPHHHRMDPTQMYNTANMIALQQQQQGGGARGGDQHQHHLAQHQQHRHMVEQMIADPNFQDDWTGILGTPAAFR
ncbi:fungal-specific transcription factor domain-containing protein [Apodospora peruviana]|uniref:Fungal-specific transcription factor domain-containing protein n=1 Tax=Apodospora peruviana TaxID=516989 RepID=A0AAE0LZV6_9PEZI|nr:fungal-specific transcription factor domain-containing protein [Apodospora peruviana]